MTRMILLALAIALTAGAYAWLPAGTADARIGANGTHLTGIDQSGQGLNHIQPGAVTVLLK